MKRLVPTAVASFAVVYLMLRGFSVSRDAATSNSTNATNTSAFDAVDSALVAATDGTGATIGLAFLAAGAAIVLYGAR